MRMRVQIRRHSGGGCQSFQIIVSTAVCRKIADIASTATEHAESQEERETRLFEALALDLLSNELVPEQKEQAKYQIRRDVETARIKITRIQHSWILYMLRKNMGHIKVPYFIFHHGIAELFYYSPSRRTRNPPTEAQLQNMLEDGMHWHASMLQSIRV